MPDPSTAGTSSSTDYEELTYATATVGGSTVSTPLVSSLRTRDGGSIGFSYDALGRLTARDLPVSPIYNRDRAYTYDNLGRMLTADGSQLYRFAYDGLGRLTQEYTFFGPIDYQYDAAGRRTRMTWPDSFHVDYDHLVTGEISAIRENGATSGAGVLGIYAYDDLGRRASLTRGNGTATSYSYDNVSRLTQLVQNLNGSGSDVTFGYSYNPAGEIASHTRSNDAYAYTGHANANIATTVDGRNQVTAIGGASVTHDGNGNVSSVPAAGSLTGAARNYAYDSANALFSVWGSGAYQEMGPDSLDRMQGYYDGSAFAFFIYDGQQMIVETNNAGNAIARRYVPGPGTDEPLAWYEGSGTGDRRWFHADERGSVVAVSDGSGDLVGSNPNRYDDYGAPQGTLTGRFGYAGQMWLPEVGLYHDRARTYNPAMGRFMQTDPIGFGGGMNFYAYVGNNPVNFVDPMGLDDCEKDPKADATVCGNPDPRCNDEGAWFDAEPRHKVLCWTPVTYIPPTGDIGAGGGGGESTEGLRGIMDTRCASRVTDNPSSPLGVFEYGFLETYAGAIAAFAKHSPTSLGSRFGGDIQTANDLFNAINLITRSGFAVTASSSRTLGTRLRVTQATGMIVGYDMYGNGAPTQYLTAIFLIIRPANISRSGRPYAQLVTSYPGCPR